LEKNNTGDPYPLTQAQVDIIQKNCYLFATEVILNNRYTYFAKGTFPKDCIYAVPL
jgi:hypothetical protein